jgi:hypothetical protein
MTPALFTFRPPYSVSGESGKSWGPTRQDIGELGITAAQITFRSMDADLVQLVCEGGAGPEYMQQVSLWDASSARVFSGVCTGISEEWDGAKTVTTATISGPWWWLEQVQLTSILTDGTGNEQERVAFTFPSQDLAVSIRALITRLGTLGVPLQAGEIAQTFPVPQMQFQNGTGDSVLSTMLQFIPDCATRFRYDTPTPTLDVIRRPWAPVVTYDLRADDNRAGIPRIQEQRQLIPSSVTVQTMRVNSAGVVLYESETAGQSTPTTPLGRQILALSGPGRSDFRSYTPRIGTLRTETVSGFSGVFALARLFDPVIIAAEAATGLLPWTSYGDAGNLTNLPRGISGTGSFRVVEGRVVDFMTTEFNVVEAQTRVMGWVFGAYPSTGAGPTAVYLRDNGQRASFAFQGGVYNLAVFVDFLIPTVAASYPTLTVFVHPEDQALVTPVPGLAANLFAAQNYTPAEGSMPLFPGAPLPLPGNRVNISGGIPKWATIGAMTSELDIDLLTGGASVTMGRGPANASNLINQFSQPLSGKIVNV